MSENRTPSLGTVGFIGLGAMGGRMVRNIRGADRLIVLDANAELTRQVAAAADATAASGLADLKDADIVVLMLPDSNVVDAVFRAEDRPSLLKTLKRGAIVVDMSSSTPTRTVANAAIAREHGLTFIDAPVSGGVGGAESGKLAIMAGGEAADFERVRPLLECMGSSVIHVGAIGSGHAVKSLNNLLSATIFVATTEVFAAGEKFGLDPAVMHRVVNASSGSSFATHIVWPKAMLPQTYDFGFALQLMHKDVGIAMSLIEATATDTPLVKAAAAMWSDALKAVPKGADMTELARRYRQSVGL